MLYTLLCFLLIIVIIKLLNIEWVWSVFGLIVLVLAFYLFSNVILGIILGISILAIPAIILLVRRDNKIAKIKMQKEQNVIEERPKDKSIGTQKASPFGAILIIATVIGIIILFTHNIISF